jgi:DnaJ homolog subfamily C member 7
MGKRKEHSAGQSPSAKRPGQTNSSPEAIYAKMPRVKDRRPTIRIGERPTRSVATNNPLHNNAGEYPIPEVKVILDEEALPSLTSTLRPRWRNSEKPPELYHLPLSEENLRKLETSTESNSSPGAYMRRRGSPAKKDKKKEKEDRNSHPLNLPPEELRRLSAAIARAESARGSMDVDGSDQNGVTSPPPPSPPVTPSQATPGAFPENTNGPSSEMNGEDKSPTPPPHRTPMKPPVDAEACKAAGNKFFKARDYLRAVTEYTKGATLHVTLHVTVH